MDATASRSRRPNLPSRSGRTDAPKNNRSHLLDALKTAPRRSSRRAPALPVGASCAGLFRSAAPGHRPPQPGLPLAEGLYSKHVRTEAKGRLIVEWVRGTPRGVGFVHDHDSPKAVLSELKQLIGDTRGGIPVWMADVRTEIARLTTQFEERTRDMTNRLDELGQRVDAALRRIDTAPRLSEAVARVVPWGETALEYLDRRTQAGARGPCSLAELFHAVRLSQPMLSVPEFHDGLRRLHDTRGVRLSSDTAFPGLRTDPEYAMLVGSELCSFVSR